MGIDNLFGQASAVDYTITARTGNNLGSNTLLFSIPMADFHRLSVVANDTKTGEIAQRGLNVGHALALGKYILKGLVTAAHREFGDGDPQVAIAFDRILHKLNPQPYTAMQPAVVSLRTAGANGSYLRWERFPENGPPIAVRVHLSQRDLLYVVDGQHRREGVDILLRFLDEVRQTGMYPAGKSSLYPHDAVDRMVPREEVIVWDKVYLMARSTCTIAVEAHLGLTIDQERQLFHDLNNKGRAVEKSLAFAFDLGNPINQFIKSELIDRGIRLAAGDRVDFDDADSGAMTRRDLVAVNAHLFLSKSNINSATAPIVDERRVVALRFWETVRQVDGFGERDARQRTVLAQPVMLKAIAKLTFDFAFGRPQLRSETHLNRLLDGLTDLDLSHENPIWRYFEDASGANSRFPGLAEYLPEQGTGNRDIGAFDPIARVMRFGAKHNDIYPILGDMIRFQLGLPNRHQ